MATNFLKKNEKLSAAILYLILISVMYAPVVFFGKSLQPSLYQPHGVVEGWPYGYKGRIPVNTFNIDLASPAYYEWPINKLVGDIYKKGELPLWNPYQGAGTPLLTQYSTRVFFPYQILEDVSPVWTWDFYLLGRLWIAGFFTFLFLRLLNLSPMGAFIGGIFYMFSGTMVWFINLEQMANNAMMVPVLLYCLERLVQRGTGKEVAISGIVFGMVLLAGQPEIALYILFLGTCYFIFRIISISQKSRFFVWSAKLVAALAIGLCLAAPLILPFIEFLDYAFHIHPTGGDMGTRFIIPSPIIVNYFTPTFSELPGSASFLPFPLGEVKDTAGKNIFFRTFPVNGEWDSLGGYTGILAVFFAIAGIIDNLLFKKSPERRNLQLFFLAFGAFIILKNFGVTPFHLIGYLPLFDQVWTPRWAGPTWTFSFAVAGALGVESIKGQINEIALKESIEKLKGQGRKVSIINFIDRYRNSGIITLLVHIIVYLLSFIFALNHRERLGMLAGTTLADIKDNIYSLFPISLVAFIFIVVIFSLWKKRSISYLSLPQYCLSAFLHTVLLNVISYSFGDQVRFFYNLTGIYLFFILFVWKGINIVLFRENREKMGIVMSDYFSRISDKLGINRNSFLRDNLNIPALSTFFVLLVIYILIAFVFFNTLKVFYKDSYLIVKPYIIPSMVLGAAITIIIMAYALFVSIYYRRKKGFFYGVVSLVVLELWWHIPRGYSNEWIFLKLIPFVIGGFIVWVSLNKRWFMAIVSGILFFISFSVIDFKAPYGFPDRYDPFTKAPYIDFLKKDGDYYRAMGGYGILFPNFSSALGLQEIKYINALSIDSFQHYRTKYLHTIGLNEESSGVLWFTGRPELEVDPTNRKIQTSKDMYTYRGLEEDFKANLLYYSLLGVKYILLPKSVEIANNRRDTTFFPLIYSKEIRIYKNPNVFPRVYLAHKLKYATSFKEAQKDISKYSSDLQHLVILEDKAPEGFPDGDSGQSHSSATITEYKPNNVSINASMEKAGILVLSDIYFPGWKVYVDGKPEKIYRVNGLVRGVFLEKGDHRITFRYLPKSFLFGLMLSGVAAISCLTLFAIREKKELKI